MTYKGYTARIEFDQKDNIFTGKRMLRVSPEIPAKALAMAKTSGKSLNQWAEES
jgi:predicted HicB family RNase H-like nuclease